MSTNHHVHQGLAGLTLTSHDPPLTFQCYLELLELLGPICGTGLDGLLSLTDLLLINRQEPKFQWNGFQNRKTEVTICISLFVHGERLGLGLYLGVVHGVSHVFSHMVGHGFLGIMVSIMGLVVNCEPVIPCKPEKQNEPLLRALVTGLTFQSQARTLSRSSLETEREICE